MPGGPSATYRTMRPILWLLVLAALGIILYAPASSIPYFEDDLGVVYLPAPEEMFHFFSEPWYSAFYRPVPATALLLIQRSFGMETWPIPEECDEHGFHSLARIEEKMFQRNIKKIWAQLMYKSLIKQYSKYNDNVHNDLKRLTALWEKT